MSLPSCSLHSQLGTVAGMFISNKMIARNFSQYRRYRTRRSHEAFHGTAGTECNIYLFQRNTQNIINNWYNIPKDFEEIIFTYKTFHWNL